VTNLCVEKASFFFEQTPNIDLHQINVRYFKLKKLQQNDKVYLNREQDITICLWGLSKCSAKFQPMYHFVPI